MKIPMNLKKSSFLLPILLLVSGCSSLPDWLGSGEDNKLKGERYAVMEDTSKIIPNADLAGDNVEIPEASETPSNGSSTGNYVISGDLSKVKRVSAGDEPDDEFILSYPPVVDADAVYVIDGRSNIIAFDTKTLEQKWEKKSAAAKKDRDLPGGGMTISNDIIYSSTGFGEVIASSKADGKTIWKKSLGAPLRRPPVAVGDKVFAATIDNQLFALSILDGATLWRHSGVKESTSFYGSTSLAVKGDILIAAYSSGEIFGINTPRGNELWTELASINADRQSAASSLNDVSASPVIVDGIVYIGSNSGDMTAFNATNGATVWRQRLGSITTTPWVAGKYIFVIAQGNQLAALNRFDGRIKWVSTLPQSKKRNKQSFYSGPIMAGGKLVIVSSKGKLLQYNPQDGQQLSKIDVPEGIYSAPIIANGQLYMLTRESELVQVK